MRHSPRLSGIKGWQEGGWRCTAELRLCRVYCIVYIVHCAPNSLEFAVNNTQFMVCSEHFTYLRVQCTLWGSKCTVQSAASPGAFLGAIKAEEGAVLLYTVQELYCTGGLELYCMLGYCTALYKGCTALYKGCTYTVLY